MITENIRLILVITGALTTIATIGFFLLPRKLLGSIFRVKDISLALTRVTMSLGLIGALIGVLLVYAAFDPRIRVAAVVLGIIEKTIFAGVVLLGSLKKFDIVKWAAIGDSLMALLYVGYLFWF